MTQKTHSKRHWLVLTACFAASLGIFRLPERHLDRAQELLLDASEPIEWLKSQVAQRWHHFRQAETNRLRSEIACLAEERDRWKIEARRSLLKFAAERDKQSLENKLGSSPFAEMSYEPLVSHDLISAAILSRDEKLWLSRNMLIGQNSPTPIESGSLVLQASVEEALLLDRGSREQLEPEFPVFAGRVVVGRLEHVGRWTSRVQRVTDPQYRGHARILRTLDDGSVAFGPEGILEGTGESLCHLRYIGKTESIREGDEVYTGSRSQALPFPMYYGKVVKAELDETEHEWSILVEPVAIPDSLQSVHILKPSLNPNRMLGN